MRWHNLNLPLVGLAGLWCLEAGWADVAKRRLYLAWLQASCLVQANRGLLSLTAAAISIVSLLAFKMICYLD